MTLTIVSFLIAIVGLAIQLTDAFPEHRETRKVIVILSLGVFLGIVASALLGAEYKITGNVDRSYALIFGLFGLAAIFGLIAVFNSNGDGQGIAAIGAFSFGVLAFLVLIGVGLGSRAPIERYSDDEIMALADRAERAGEFETTIERLEEMKRRLASEPERAAIDARIERIIRQRSSRLEGAK